MTGTVHKFTGDWQKTFQWDGGRSRLYKDDPENIVSETYIIGKEEGAENFAFRYYQVESGGHSNQEQHPYDHGILILQGSGTVLLGEETHTIARGDIVYIPPDAVHQISNTGTDPMGFLCVIPARREKDGKIVWAEEGIQFD